PRRDLAILEPYYPEQFLNETPYRLDDNASGAVGELTLTALRDEQASVLSGSELLNTSLRANEHGFATDFIATLPAQKGDSGSAVVKSINGHAVVTGCVRAIDPFCDKRTFYVPSREIRAFLNENGLFEV
ncbi:MAG: hypothetical protein VKK59_02700, partial [Vampirovibrionales bacterium]|nr:hypothetical protein [Vampirovibrionales bacterium]